MYYRVLVASERFHGNESLTYESVEKLQVGQLVSVPLQRQTVLGVVEKTAIKPAFATKPITQSWSVYVPKELLALLTWLAAYYPAPLGSLADLITPPNMPKTLDVRETQFDNVTIPDLIPLTEEQAAALRQISTAERKSVLLHGDTGTGKTRLYLELAKQNLLKNKSVIILTPEIGLTEPLVQVFADTFPGRVLVTHSHMTAKERRLIWLKVAFAAKPLIVIGPRSALFTPLKNVGLIVMDEAHDTAYKQEQMPYYQTSRVAARLAHLHDANFIMGTATPLITDYFLFKSMGLPIVRMIKPAITSTHKVEIQIIDQRDKAIFSSSPWLASPLIKSISTALENSEQSLLFLNRRGSARVVLCQQCGWQALCPHCDTGLTYHEDQHLMRCHSCNFSAKVPMQCPECGAAEIIFRSIGTKALETEVHRLFPRARINRFDGDTHKSEGLAAKHDALQRGDVDIVIGTQAVIKGFDLPKLAVVGVIQADSSLQFPDYTASERTFQLISQVSGRIGRGHRAGQLFIQTFEPANPLFAYATTKDYAAFYDAELLERKQFHFPPYVYTLKITCARASGKSAEQACQKIIQKLSQQFGNQLYIEGPTPRFIEKIAGKYGWHIIIKSANRQLLTGVIKQLPNQCTYDIDPIDLL